MLFGVASVIWWRYSNLAGQEDLRPYLLLQIAPMILIPWWQWLYDSPRADRGAFGIALLLYGAAKLAEIYDHQIGTALHGLTGHTLKHLLATAAAALIVFRLARRSVAVAEPTAERSFSHLGQYRDAVGSHQPTRNQGRNMFRAVLRFILRLVFRIEQRGDPSVFVNERTLIVANHESFIDGLLIGLMIPVDAVFVVHSQIVERPFFAFLLRFVRHLAVDSTSPLAIKQIVRLVESGQPVVIFPEGRITKTGSLMKVRRRRLRRGQDRRHAGAGAYRRCGTQLLRPTRRTLPAQVVSQGDDIRPAPPYAAHAGPAQGQGSSAPLRGADARHPAGYAGGDAPATHAI